MRSLVLSVVHILNIIGPGHGTCHKSRTENIYREVERLGNQTNGLFEVRMQSNHLVVVVTALAVCGQENKANERHRAPLTSTILILLS